MNFWLVISAIGVIAVPGCLDGRQRGKFAVTETNTVALDRPDGAITLLRGVPLPMKEAEEGQIAKPLLYCLAIGGPLSSSEKQNDVYTSSVKTQVGDTATDLAWNRQRDTVSVSGKTFKRPEGIGFAVVFEDDGDVEVFQVEIPDARDLKSALAHFKKALPHVEELKNAVLHESE